MLRPDLCVREKIYVADHIYFSIAVFLKYKLIVVNYWKNNILQGTYKFNSFCNMKDRPELLELAERAEIDPANETIGNLLCLF